MMALQTEATRSRMETRPSLLPLALAGTARIESALLVEKCSTKLWPTDRRSRAVRASGRNFFRIDMQKRPKPGPTNQRDSKLARVHLTRRFRRPNVQRLCRG